MSNGMDERTALMVQQYVALCHAYLEADDEEREMNLLDAMAASPLPTPLKNSILDAMTGVRDTAWDRGRKSDD
jgi:hypothetical protein